MGESTLAQSGFYAGASDTHHAGGLGDERNQHGRGSGTNTGGGLRAIGLGSCGARFNRLM
jgi:hypothetical protein